MVDAGKTTDQYAGIAGNLASAIKSVVYVVLTAKEVISAAVTTVLAFGDAITSTFSSAGDLIAVWAKDTGKAITAAFKLDSAGMQSAEADFKQKAAQILGSYNASI